MIGSFQGINILVLVVLLSGHMENTIDPFLDPEYAKLAMDDYDETHGRASSPTLVPSSSRGHRHGPTKVPGELTEEPKSGRGEKNGIGGLRAGFLFFFFLLRHYICLSGQRSKVRAVQPN